MVKSQRGKAGGYKLVKKPAEYTIGSIRKRTEGTLAPVGCLEEGAEKCDRATECITLPLRKKLDDQIDEYLESCLLYTSGGRGFDPRLALFFVLGIKPCKNKETES